MKRLAWVKGKHVWIAFAVSALFSLWFFGAGPYLAATNGEGLPDEQIAISVEDLKLYVLRMRADADWIDAYQAFVPFDFVFALLQGAWVAGFLLLGARYWKAFPAKLAWAPVAAMAADWIETSIFFALTNSYSNGAVGAAWVAMHIKFAAHIVAGLAAIALVIHYITHPIKRVRDR